MPHDNFNHNHSEGGNDAPPPPMRNFVPGNAERAESDRPLTDREVPVSPPGSRRETPLVVQKWLDGEATLSMVEASPGGQESAEIWTRINTEAELLRTRTTPLYVHKRIMESLPNDLHRVDRPWYSRSVALNPITLAVAAAALLGVGAFIARIAIH